MENGIINNTSQIDSKKVSKQKGEKTPSEQAGHRETNSKRCKCKHNYIKITFNVNRINALT